METCTPDDGTDAESIAEQDLWCSKNFNAKGFAKTFADCFSCHFVSSELMILYAIPDPIKVF